MRRWLLRWIAFKLGRMAWNRYQNKSRSRADAGSGSGGKSPGSGGKARAGTGGAGKKTAPRKRSTTKSGSRGGR